MTNSQKTTKKAVLAGFLSLLLCVSMLIGSTWAWFTDSAVSSGNKIQAGTLKLKLEMKNKTNEEWKDITTSSDPVFNYDMWEPGYTEAAALRITNDGSLALKYAAKFVGTAALTKLADVIDVYTSETETLPSARTDLDTWTKQGTLSEFFNTADTFVTGTLTASQSKSLAIAFKMQESAGNEYQGLSLGGAFDIQVLATQWTDEADSFGNDYDANAFLGVRSLKIGDKSYNVSDEFADSLGNDIDDSTNKIPANTAFTAEIMNAADLVALEQMIEDGVIAVNNGEIRRTVNIGADIDMSGINLKPLGIMRLALNGNGHSISNLTVTQNSVGKSGLFGYGGDCIINDLTLINVTAKGCQVGAFFGQTEGGTLNNCTLAGNVNITWEQCTSDYNEEWNGAGALVGWSNGTTLNNVKIADNTTINITRTGMIVESAPGAVSSQGTKNYIGAGSDADSNSDKVIVGSNVSVHVVD